MNSDLPIMHRKRSTSTRIDRKLCRLILANLLCFKCIAQFASFGVPANPILAGADPFITLHPFDGRYFLLATTGHNITIWSGATIPTSSRQAVTVYRSPEGMEQIWSPTIWQEDGHWWIYFTARQAGDDHAIYVLESNSDDPLGSYELRGSLKLGHPAIDPSLLTVNGIQYLLYVSLDRGENAIQIVRLLSPMEVAAQSSLISEPDHAWEKGAGSTRTYPIDEGPTALYHGGSTFIVFSGSDAASPFYCLGLLTFQGGNPLDRKSWKKSAEPVFSASPANGIFGPGRGTFAIAADGSDWLVYAAKSIADPTTADRKIRVQRFTWNPDGSPYFGIPVKDGPIVEVDEPSLRPDNFSHGSAA